MLITRLLTAAALLPVFVSALLLLPNKYWGVFLLPALLIASLEWAALVGYQRAAQGLFGGIVLLSSLALLYAPDRFAGPAAGLGWPRPLFVYWASAAFWLLLAPVWLVRKWRVQNALVKGVTGWIVLVPVWLALVGLQDQPARLLILLGVVWIADSAAYLTGQSLGRRRFAPQISPGKTWEGVAGACVAVAVYYAVLWSISAPRMALFHGVGGMILFAAITVMSVEGDLFESWMKRQAGVKDSGRLFPGHGGMLDRIDGLTASMPLAALSLYYSA